MEIDMVTGTRVQRWMLCLLERTDVKSATSPPKETYKGRRRILVFPRVISLERLKRANISLEGQLAHAAPGLPQSERRRGKRGKEAFSEKEGLLLSPLSPKISVP